MTLTSRNLHVAFSDRIVAPSPNHELLVAFRFGLKPALEKHPSVVDTYLAPFDHKVMYECWWVAEHVHHHNIGKIRIAECGDYAILIQDSTENSNDELACETQVAYCGIFTALRSTGHSRIAKVWNYLGAINEGDGDEERYRRFSVGRARAFAEYAIPDCAAPAATGIGTRRSRGLTTITLASRHPQYLVENPRQTSAFRYPRQFGPSSPKFARGASVFAKDHTLQLLSGTAAIVGHDSLHPFDTKLQLQETLRNITAINESLPISERSSLFRVYLRNADDYEFVKDKLASQPKIDTKQLIFLHGDICRRELLIELDGVRVA